MCILTLIFIISSLTFKPKLTRFLCKGHSLIIISFILRYKIDARDVDRGFNWCLTVIVNSSGKHGVIFFFD